ncbi:hypothetical protein PPH41_26800 [Burkholderia gladioli]|nr:hypothetical protein [Burkholderia gladioli]MDC6131447.1 hypothetical protein [Burkholderia gladioli]MDN7919728.1 hypothetical protein [Burkholderia gladioli]
MAVFLGQVLREDLREVVVLEADLVEREGIDFVVEANAQHGFDQVPPIELAVDALAAMERGRCRRCREQPVDGLLGDLLEAGAIAVCHLFSPGSRS